MNEIIIIVTNDLMTRLKAAKEGREKVKHVFEAISLKNNEFTLSMRSYNLDNGTPEAINHELFVPGRILSLENNG